MLTVNDIIGMCNADNARQSWNRQIACLLIHKEDLALQVPMDGASIFSFAFVRRGTLTIKYNGTEMELKANDIHTYAPGMPTITLHVSDDYEGYCVIIDEKLVLHTPLMNHLIKAAYQPVAEFRKPLFSLSGIQASRMWNLLTLLREYIFEPMDFKKESLLALCEVFCIDLINIQNVIVESHKINSRHEDIFSGFLQLVSDNYMIHRDLKFYADKLNISIPYLSRIVRMMSGRTVMSFIEYALVTEITRRLKTTDTSITEMAFDFAFSDQASFSKFFIRMKGTSPRDFRKSRKILAVVDERDRKTK